MGFDTSDNCLLGRPRALDAMLAQVRLQPCVLEAATLRARGCSPMPSRPRRDSGADWGGSPTSTSLYLCMLPLCCPSAAAPTHTQFVNDSSYSRVYAALGAGARAQGRAHLPELQLKVGHSLVYSIVHHMDMVCRQYIVRRMQYALARAPAPGGWQPDSPSSPPYPHPHPSPRWLLTSPAYPPRCSATPTHSQRASRSARAPRRRVRC